MDDFVFNDDCSTGKEWYPSPSSPSQSLLKILVADPDHTIFSLFKNALKNFSFNEKDITLLNAKTPSQLLNFLKTNPDTAIIFLNSNFQPKSSKTDFIKLIRHTTDSQINQIILMGDVSDSLPAHEAIQAYEITDYILKADLNHDAILKVISSSIKAYCDKSKLHSELYSLKEQEKDEIKTQLRQSQRLEAVGTLAGGIAHDFNNILGGILGYAQLMQFELKKNQICMEYTDQIITGCTRAKNLILQILNFSRKQEEQTSSKITNPIEIVTETIKLLRASFPSSIKIESQIDKTTGCIQADPSQIHQAIMNLCTNARQSFVNDMGQVTLSLNETPHSKKNPIKGLSHPLKFGTYICIQVSDTGKGIPAHANDKIFDPYFTTKSRGEGTGLGLSVVQGIITRFKGAVTIKSSPGKGSVFTLYFPQYTSHRKKIQKTTKPLIKGTARVLFIDDEPTLVHLGKKMLEKLGYQVSAVGSPLTALNILQKKPCQFDLVITDMTMPDIHGTQLATKIKEINQNLPVVLTTGYTNLKKALGKKTDNIDAVIAKPIEINALSKTIGQLMSQKRP